MSTSPLTADRVRADVAELLQVPAQSIADDDNLFDLGLDSVRVMTLIQRWRDAGAAELEFPDLAEQPELAHWQRLVVGG
ncbi:acyl carrier protein [Tsukamurella tyrosinosolvens]|uniref:Aryl carrier domain-containing protein n=1 Tax=Tsukamurella tyrosinosolvens TaxID=57704 RepID=A0A1H5AKM9_TSUTY|nr:phosphopantetheine-binding protein [Tsukamurella tyrosinosolvens]AUN42195.1 acyl carrier protein [Tsukamurella tyrosinosolvens]KXO95320.1 acyl carrier protein [Tsukamurella tyrosinosolvens]KXP07457.1 acyl carrier protein [Tsukamurella tyrosinosolvens]KZL98658.1 acyl carrier protein [Tsukamurella tyrosinosolvens]MCA4994869.1 acyl carrier protein [Tsukamurella tyrosinosolvens]